MDKSMSKEELALDLLMILEQLVILEERITNGFVKIRDELRRLAMSPATSESQRRLFCLALSIKQGITPKSRSKEAARLAATTTEAQLSEFCKSKVKE